MSKYSIKCGGGKTKQAMANECDINSIIAKAVKAGGLPRSEKLALYADVSNVPDYHTAHEIVLRAQAQFQALPSLVRDRFNNEPANFLAFMHDEKNQDEAIELGLIEKPLENKTEIVTEKIEEVKKDDNNPVDKTPA